MRWDVQIHADQGGAVVSGFIGNYFYLNRVKSKTARQSLAVANNWCAVFFKDCLFYT